MLLVSTLQRNLPLTGFHYERLARIDAHDFENVRRKTKKDLAALGINVDDEYLDAGILALKQYYAIALLDSLNMHAVSDKVDPFWHAHVLHTKEYAKFCDEVVGGFMHHDPLDHDKPEDIRFVGGLYDFTMERYKACFEHVDARFHPVQLESDELVCTHGNDAYEAAQHALFPREARAQPLSTWAH